MKRKEISTLIFNELNRNEKVLKEQYTKNKKQIAFFYLDNLLPENLVKEIHNCFPKLEETVLRKSLKEYKYTAFKMNKYNALLEEIIYAFQEDVVVQKITDICELNNVFPDDKLYAGGLSLMKKGNFLNPHLDNSHDRDRNMWRVLNLLFYVTPDWKKEYGGNLELWVNGLKNSPVEVKSKFNRLVVMVTHQNSWHSVNKIKIDKIRCCVSNYYFSNQPVLETDMFHVTSFKGRPNEKLKNILFTMNNKLRMGVRSFFKRGIRENPHQYKKKL